VFAILPAGSAFAQAPVDTLGPVTSAVVVAPSPVLLDKMVTITALVDDTTTGNSNIKSAEYSLNGGPWTAMSAVDGAFDTVSEPVTAAFKASTLGQNQVCVQAKDVLDNLGAQVCATFNVQYLFKGFFSPVRMNKDNLAKSGRTIPLKWRLTSGAGKPINDRSSFVAVKSYAVDCEMLSGDPLTAVIESAPGKSGLQNHGSGYWHFNWKTSKSYNGTCRKMFVAFKGGQMSPEVVFRFK
jgi:hypothetical protein